MNPIPDKVRAAKDDERVEWLKRNIWAEGDEPVLSEGAAVGPANARIRPRVEADLSASPHHHPDAGRTVHAIGVREVKGKHVICFYVSKKFHRSEVSDSDRIPPDVKGVPTMVIESRPAVFHYDDPATVEQPLMAGIWVSDSQSKSGTLACFCRPDKAPAGVYVLGNSHVLARSGEGMKGDRICQPSQRASADYRYVGELQVFDKLSFEGTFPNYTDAAVARLDGGIPSEPVIKEIGTVYPSVEATVDQAVRKRGAYSGLTGGTITDITYDVNVKYDTPHGTMSALFLNQIRVDVDESFQPIWAGPGDSGALVVDTQNAAVGLHIGGGDDGTYGVVNHMKDVEARMEITVG